MTSNLNTGGLVIVVAILLVASVFTRAALRRIRVPGLVGYLLLGFLLRGSTEAYDFLGTGGDEVLRFLGQIGVIVLLFRVGLDSDLAGLWRQLASASLLWVGDVTLSGFTGFACMHWLLGFDTIPSLIVATALMATSVGIPVKVWQDQDALGSRHGRRFLDVAELDDISSVLAMAVLFACLAALADASGAGQHPVREVAQNVATLLLKLLGFGALCYLFARWGESRLTRATEALNPPPVRMLVVAGVGFLIAGLAAALGFSVAIGAFLAGLAFSRDPHSVRIEASFQSVYELFMPFFFIGIGRSIAPETLWAGIQLGGAVLGAAVLGKLLGIVPSATVMGGPRAGVLLGVSMIPRAEVALLVMHRGLHLGEWAVPQRVYAAMVLTSAVTCIAGPLFLQLLLVRWPQSSEAD